MVTNIKVVEKVGKNSGKNVVIMAGVHGNEVCGVKAFDILIPEINIDNGKVIFIIANLKAVQQNKRYIEYNLNRCFLDNQPAEIMDTLEGKTAKEIIFFLQKADALLDLHSSKSSDSSKYLICERDCFDIIHSFSPEKVIMGIDDIQQGGSDGYMYRQGKPGICIECGLHESKDSIGIAKEAIQTFLIETGNINGISKKKITKKLFRSIYLYKNKNGPFRLERKFNDFEKMTEKTLIGYDGFEKIYLKRDDVVMFPDEPKEIGGECFMVIREETLLKSNQLNKVEKDLKNENANS